MRVLGIDCGSEYTGFGIVEETADRKLVCCVNGAIKLKSGTPMAAKLEKTPVEVNDAPGFVSNRVLMPLLNEAMFAVMEGVATPEAVDEVFKLGMAHPMGPLTLADFIGLDVCLDIMRVLHNGLGDPKYRPCPLLIKMVDAGRLGKKAGRGFYKY